MGCAIRSRVLPVPALKVVPTKYYLLYVKYCSKVPCGYSAPNSLHSAVLRHTHSRQICSQRYQNKDLVIIDCIFKHLRTLAPATPFLSHASQKHPGSHAFWSTLLRKPLCSRRLCLIFRSPARNTRLATTEIRQPGVP